MVKKLNNDQVRQGDVLLTLDANAKAAGKEIPLDKDGSLTLAHGEVTGHRHRLEFMAGEYGSATAYGLGTTPEPDVLVVQKPKTLVHEEHSAAPLAPGNWIVSRPFEYTGAELRRVAD